MNRSYPTRLSIGLMVLLAIGAHCRRPDPERASSPLPDPEEAEILEFPLELQAEDRSVNEFVRQVIDTCVSGDYDAFRMLWCTRDKPFPRDQFHRAWRSVQRVRIVSLRPVRDPRTREILYAVRAHVALDPSVREPERDVRMLLIQEGGRWRLTGAPSDVPDELFEPPSPASQPTEGPADDGTR